MRKISSIELKLACARVSFLLGLQFNTLRPYVTQYEYNNYEYVNCFVCSFNGIRYN